MQETGSDLLCLAEHLKLPQGESQRLLPSEIYERSMVPTRVRFWRFSLPVNRLSVWPVGGEGMEPEDADRLTTHSFAFLAAFA